jgi:hypothetical protein
MLRRLKFVGFVVINVIIAVIGTAILDTALSKAIPSHSIAGVLWKEYILSIICAACLGFSVWRSWRDSAAKWTWVLPAAWFTAGLIAVAGRDDVFGRIFGYGSGSNLGAAEIRTFFAFTVPLIRGISYSAGAYISSFLYRAPVASQS